jgi:hypothetical protein
MPDYTDNVINMEEDDMASQTSYASSVNASIKIPALPKDAQVNDFFECPLCFMIVSIHTEVDWKYVKNSTAREITDYGRKHVYQDLHPYCCTFEDCATADRL